MRIKLLFSVSLLIMFAHSSSGQGCSDAGFCTAGSMQGGMQLYDSSMTKNSLGGSVTFGNGEKGTSILTAQLEGRLVISGTGYFEAKVPFTNASGNVGSNSGFGDPILTFTKVFSSALQPDFISATIGGRFGTGAANAADKGVPLPMPYQTTLGTTDLIAGLNLKLWQYLNASVGIQQPVFQYNRNNYFPALTTTSDKMYFVSNELRRKGDALFRIEGTYQWKKVALACGPLFIYHLGEDEYTDLFGNTVSLSGSDGLTLNLTARATYRTKAGNFSLATGAPFIVRTSRPDGLTRGFVLTLRYSR